MKASDFIVQFLIQNEIPYVFGYIGGMVAHIVDSLYQSEKIEMINSIHEQGAGFAADAFARSTGKVGVAIATSGPGATNLITPIADCFFDSVPAVFITGQVNTFEYKKFSKIRQTGFQETDIVSIVKPITKHAITIKCVENLKYELEKAFYLSRTGRKGPVLLDIPMNIQRADFDFTHARSFSPPVLKEKKLNLNKIINILKESKRPLVLIGNGVRLSNATQKLRQFLNQTDLPVVQSLLGLDSVESSYKFNLGLIGTYGNRYANIALSLADTILVLGARLDIRQIGANTDIFSTKKIIQVDIDCNQLNCNNLRKIKINDSVDHFLEQISTIQFHCEMYQWQQKLLSLKKKYPSTLNLDKAPHLPNQIISQIMENLRQDDIICGDVGQNQLWIAQSAKIKNQTRYLTSGGLGSMGFALPAGIGATFSGKRSIVISGDGGIQMNIQELEMIKRRNLPVKIIVMNNHGLGMVRQFQDAYFEGRNASTIEDYSEPSFEKIAAAYGIKSYKIIGKNIDSKFWKTFFSDNTPALVNVILDQKTQIIPKVLYGHTIDDMQPFLSTDELEEAKKV